MRSPLRLALAATGLLSMLLAVPTTASAITEDEEPLEYVAMGDSYASLGTASTHYTDPATGCVRATDNYPSRLAEELAPDTFVDVTCAGAVTGGVLNSQLSALTPDTDLVTLTIGGNDIGFGAIAATCGSDSLTNPLGSPCEQRFTTGGTDQLAARIGATAPKIDAVLAGIREHAPHAEIVVVGYLRILPPALGCWPVVPISVGDVPYLNGVQRGLNTMIGERATAAGATFVNPGETTGHDACQLLPWRKWIEGPFPILDAAPMHPTAAGQAHVADLVADTL
ncbi:SGNH/GDSL hydrolase family protein [Streptomyces sp. NBC_01803]|uniref:SGNH/GDSL hydrolase family protein n=1 Tax=Streptomyces sp. NBC_01803 TaxID=2975946 RepID=UPI002DDBE589|nr:SGNH/GDSL hydrolase family protein [Streptomyces sp. NBC_01803]WSA46793.1 SGNH/GDSL hydrolase family protein [Streptomyces sp. NBC_01803]